VGERAQEPVGGAARFASALKAQAANKPLVLFSGDVFNPSLMSTVTKGKVHTRNSTCMHRSR
jgi:5'-nucleotidase